MKARPRADFGYGLTFASATSESKEARNWEFTMSDARRQRRSKEEQDRILSMELEMTFPASDPPASTQPGSGVTGPAHRRARPPLAQIYERERAKG
jgi:hypothetical protein